MTRISAIAWLIAFTGFFAACTEEEQISPSSMEINEEEKSVAGEEFESSAKKKYDGLYTEATGSVDGREFRGTFIVKEFIEASGNVYALGNLVDTKIKGKDHKKLEYVLELESYSIPVNNISGEASAETDQITISKTCTILTLELGETTANLLGLEVTIDPSSIVVDASDDEVLGELICTALETAGSVLDVVGLLNQILGILSII